MAAKRVQYQIVGRYMDGKEVTGYHLLSLESGKAGRYTKEQVAFLTGRDQITNCEGQIYKDKLLLRGVGISLDSLPVQQENGTLSRTDSIGKVRRGTSAEDAMTQLMLIGYIMNGKSIHQYVVQNAGGGQDYMSKDQFLPMARAGRIGNARVQLYQGKPILKGVNCNLKELPRKDINEM